MEIIKFKYNDREYFGKVEKEKVIELINFDFSKDFFQTGFTVSKYDIEIIPPLEPSKIIGIALNNKKLVGQKKKYDEPLIFLKSPTSLTFSSSITIPKSNIVWVEVEIGIVIKKDLIGSLTVNMQNSGNTFHTIG